MLIVKDSRVDLSVTTDVLGFSFLCFMLLGCVSFIYFYLIVEIFMYFIISGQSSVGLVGPRYTLGGASDLFVQILRFLLQRILNFLLFITTINNLTRLYLLIVTGVPVCQLKMQEVLPQPVEAFKAYLDGYVQEAT